MTASSQLGREQPLVLALGGGNALGSYLAGAYEHLQQRGIEPQWIVGGSIGAVTGAIIAGNAPEDRMPRLRAFWDEAMIRSPGLLGRGTKIRHAYNEIHTITALLFGRPGLFGHRFPGMLSMLPWMPGDVALYDHKPLLQTLERLVDFERLNRGDIRLTVGCVDLESGEEVFFDTVRDTLTPEHFLASSAITPVFPPVEIGGRLLCDPGYTNNLPLDVPFAEPLPDDFTCIAVELFSLQASRPASLDATAERANDLIFASPTRRSLEALKREYALRDRWEPDGPQATLLHMAYYAGSDERAGKTFDYSPSSIQDRWAAGRRDMERSLALLDGAPAEGRRFRYLALGPQEEAASAERGAGA
ncbi:patatin-like phospholipase family protein [Microvirga arsenatis]|uniref:Patatin-like phospholipase family protein n=1 Tax=Microvirga arsenatis TaxID=2692265 RepID=A0ABW9YY38_9HYPH|nr:patatin-like phospholipase family protein [Microvirga arsenatis]NBJ09406.1 patatin-like phospholipase family protein [Microvirga arsenatis]NBJ23736.1 patatin-like phospholipase family protein [Microvirga arsenatis]